MNVLIVGSGGREHALGWKIAQSPLLKHLFFSPGNPGTRHLGTNLPAGGVDDIVRQARAHTIDLVVVGPEQPLVDGLADALADAGIACFGPNRAAARLEGSKAFAKRVMRKAGVPTAACAIFDDTQAARDYLAGAAYPLVIKADGLAAGKGVTVCPDVDRAQAALKAAMVDRVFGDAGKCVVIEDCLMGTEASYHIICDGRKFVALPTAQDHKALLNGNQGPNTGGMGTFAPNPNVTRKLAQHIETDIAAPVLQALQELGCPFKGVLFLGLMLTDEGPKVLEFNVRFGDPETQVILPLMDCDLLAVLRDAAAGSLDMPSPLPQKAQSAVCVVLAAKGYPTSPEKGRPISGLAQDWGPDAVVFHAGTKQAESGGLETSGGRVLGVTAWAEDLYSARHQAYCMANAIEFEGKYMRTDIGEP